VIVKNVQGIWLPDSDDHFEFHLRQGEKFRGAGTYQMRKIVAAIDATFKDRRRLAIDVGAHVGLWTRVLCPSFSRVVAFEPVPDLLLCLAANLEGINNIEVYDVALSSTSVSSLSMTAPGSNSGNWAVSCSVEEAHIEVPARTLDSYGFTGVDLVKIDVEGWEREVLLGGEETIRSCKPVVVVEQKPGNAERYGVGQLAAVDLLKSWGAEVLWIKAGDYCMGWRW
jgi:FkbM family methyltransferase